MPDFSSNDIYLIKTLSSEELLNFLYRNIDAHFNKTASLVTDVFENIHILFPDVFFGF